MSPAVRKTTCTCLGPGYCARHRVYKNKSWFFLCQNDGRYFEAWERGQGPGQGSGYYYLPKVQPWDYYALYPHMRILNLIYHVYPLMANDIWRQNVTQLLRRWHVFNGRKVVAIVQGEGIHPEQVVRDVFDDDSIEYIVLPNNPILREVVTFRPLLERIQSVAEDECSFYAHTKGNATHESVLGSELWRNAMYHHLLDHVNVAMDLLRMHPCVGTHKMCYPNTCGPFPTRLHHGHWMFSGTFFWFRHRDVFTQPNWADVPVDRYGAEAWLSGLFHQDQAATVFQPWPVHALEGCNPYDPRIYHWPIRD